MHSLTFKVKHYPEVPSIQRGDACKHQGSTATGLSTAIKVFHHNFESHQVRIKQVASEKKSCGCLSIRCDQNGASGQEHISGSRQDNNFLEVKDVSYRPSGSTSFILRDVNLTLPKKSLGLICGRSGSGKTTLLQLLAGMATPTKGSIFLGSLIEKESQRLPCSRSELADKAGIVFQFPERYFLSSTVVEELTFGWPRRAEDFYMRQMLAVRLQSALFSVGLTDLPLDKDPKALSGGNQRKLALATQLVRMPQLLILDEPLAGLDWKARADVVKLLAELKKDRTILAVSHDLGEFNTLVDKCWIMENGGLLQESTWPPSGRQAKGELFRLKAKNALQ